MHDLPRFYTAGTSPVTQVARVPTSRRTATRALVLALTTASAALLAACANMGSADHIRGLQQDSASAAGDEFLWSAGVLRLSKDSATAASGNPAGDPATNANLLRARSQLAAAVARRKAAESALAALRK